jgi:hypothetical protein
MLLAWVVDDVKMVVKKIHVNHGNALVQRSVHYLTVNSACWMLH